MSFEVCHKVQNRCNNQRSTDTNKHKWQTSGFRCRPAPPSRAKREDSLPTMTQLSQHLRQINPEVVSSRDLEALDLPAQEGNGRAHEHIHLGVRGVRGHHGGRTPGRSGHACWNFPHVRPRDRGHDLHRGPHLGSSHEPRGHHCVRAHQALPVAPGARVCGGPVRGGDRGVVHAQLRPVSRRGVRGRDVAVGKRPAVADDGGDHHLHSHVRHLRSHHRQTIGT